MKILLIIIFTSLCFHSLCKQVRNKDILDYLFNSQDFYIDLSNYQIYLKDQAKFWSPHTDLKSHYIHSSGQDLVFINYPNKKSIRVSRIKRSRPSRLKSVLIKNNKIESVYICNIWLAPGILAPSGIKKFSCHFINQNTCNALDKAHYIKSISGINNAHQFMLEVAKTLTAEKKAYLDVYISVYRFLLDKKEMSESDLQVQNYLDSYRSLCMAVRKEIGAKVRFKYDQDSDYEKNICIDHSQSFITTKELSLTHQQICSDFF